MPAGEVTVRLNLNKDGYSAGMTAARKEAQLLKNVIEETGHQTVSSMQASSAAIRVLEGGMTGNIRAAERFIGMLPGVGTALKAAFPLVGGIALAGVFVKIGEEVANAIRKIEQMPTAIENGFRTLNMSAQTANDSLRVTNDRLENEIAKLEGKPQNNLMLAIDEARLAADKFAEALDRDNQKVKELLSQNSIGRVAALTTNRESTVNVAGTSNSFNQQIADLGARYSLAVGGHADEAGGTPEELLKQINEKRAAGVAKMNEFIREARAKQATPSNMNAAPLLEGLNVSGPDQAAVIAAAEGERTALLKQGDSQEQGARNATDEAKRAKLQADKDAQEAAKRALAAAKAAQEAIVAQWRKDLDEARISFDNILVQEAQFWVQRMESARKGSLSYIAALDEANKDIAKLHKKSVDDLREFDALQGGSAQDHPGDTDAQAKARLQASDHLRDIGRATEGSPEKEQGRETAEWLRTLNEGISMRRADADAIAEQSLRMEVLTGRMTKLGEAQSLATLHAQAFADAQERIDEALENANSLPEGPDKQRTIEGLKNQRNEVGAQAQMQAAQDQYGVSQNKIGPAVKTALDQMVQSWTDMAKNLKDVIPRTIEGLNDSIAKLATGQGQKGDFGRTFKQAGEGLVKTGLGAAEGMALSFLSHGKIGTKRDGSAETAALWVQIANAAMGASSSIGTSSPARNAMVGLAGLVPGGSFIQPFLSSLIPHAGGGNVLAGHAYLVGERGPEPFFPGVSGTMLPASSLGGGDTHFHIDARGATDPMAVHAAVARALPHAVAASVQAGHQAKMRSPGGR